MNKFSDWNAKPSPRKLPLPLCIYCPMRARVSCADCGAPMCGRCKTVEGNTLKCRAHKKKLEVGEVVKGVLG